MSITIKIIRVIDNKIKSMHKCVADKYDKSQTSGTNKANSKSGCKEREKKEKLFKLQTVVCFVIKEISI